MSHRKYRFGGALVAALLGGVITGSVALQNPRSSSSTSAASTWEWRSYGGDLNSHRYAPLDQINGGNFKSLEVAWRFKTDNLGPRREFRLEATPLMVNNTLYSVAGTRRAVVALNPTTGELRWVYSLDEGARAEASPRRLSGRGLAYWSDGKDERIFYVTIGYQLVALDAHTGRPISSFGNGGIVDLKQNNDQQIDPITGEVGLHSAPIVVNGVVIVQAAHKEGGIPKSKSNVKGYIRGFDVRTGKRLWIFHTIPQRGEFGNDTWLEESWTYTGNTGVWGSLSADEALGLVYLPVESPTGDYYGGTRPGNNLFGETLVAVDVKTGQRKWHFQFVHHPIWDMDLPAAPVLADVNVDGRPRKIVAVGTKQCFLYVFDRATGEPIWPIEERPVAKGDVPREWYSPTQPFPTKPPAYCRQGVTVDDLIDFTPALRQEALKLFSKYKLGPIFTPPVLANPQSTIATLYASSGGGTNWQGTSYDPETHILYAGTQSMIRALSVVPAPPGVSDMPYIAGANQGLGGGGGPLFVQGLPLGKPPYGSISAINLDRGDLLWRVPHGETPDNVRLHPALKGLNLPRTGQPGAAGTLVTKTLLIAGDNGVITMPSGERGAMLRAYDKATGQEIGGVYMPAPQSGAPMTYMLNGKQYIVIAISGGPYSAELLAFRLPS